MLEAFYFSWHWNWLAIVIHSFCLFTEFGNSLSVCLLGLDEGSLGRICFVRELLCVEGALLGFGLAVSFDIFLETHKLQNHCHLTEKLFC